MNLDAYIFAFGVISMIIGYVIGRWEKQGEQTRTYRRGFNIGKQVGRNESK